VIFTLPAEAIAKYCYDFVCVCMSVCLSARISLELHMRSLPNFWFMLPMAVAQSWQGDEIPRGRGSFRGFLPIDNALYSMAFGIHTNTADPIEMSFG